jgi:hypothetical protein
MEVHHPHHPAHKKKWSEYILEFFMLFLAVSLGFFAENLREHQVEKHREISYLKNVHEDLLLDLKNIENVMNQNTVRLHAMDTLFDSINHNSITNEDVYYYIRNLALRATFESSHVGLDQIKSAGGLRMIKNPEIISGIQEYERTLNSIEKVENVRERTLEQARFKMAAVFEPTISYEMLINQNPGQGIMRFNRPKKADEILQKNKSAVKELLNLVTFGLNSNRYINNSLAKEKIIGQQLDSAILKEYGEKFD